MLVNALAQLPLLIGTLGAWMQGRKHRSAPALGFASEFFWAGWAIYAHLWSIVPWCILWMAIYARTWWLWGERSGQPTQ